MIGIAVLLTEHMADMCPVDSPPAVAASSFPTVAPIGTWLPYTAYNSDWRGLRMQLLAELHAGL